MIMTQNPEITDTWVSPRPLNEPTPVSATTPVLVMQYVYYGDAYFLLTEKHVWLQSIH